ncbi:MAG TPA: ubiquitin-like small modifier protein 1 [Candidatus Nanopelagicales bacterium]|nr:ubiquitin-like small modifier protein 1 [Candidatus Nanopelagicales bacterium]
MNDPGVTVRLPSALSDVAGARSLVVAPTPDDVAALLDGIRDENPALERRIRDETGALRRFINVYVDGDDVRHLDGPATTLRPGSEVHVIPSVAGG